MAIKATQMAVVKEEWQAPAFAADVCAFLTSLILGHILVIERLIGEASA